MERRSQAHRSKDADAVAEFARIGSEFHLHDRRGFAALVLTNQSS
jgi:hypothetical protein